MLNLLTSSQMRHADELVIKNEGITSLELMQKASSAFVNIFIERFPNTQESILIFCGTGNNGGDGLCIARLLWEEGFRNLKVYVVRYNTKTTPNFESNLNRLIQSEIPYFELQNGDDLPTDTDCDLFIDAMLGTGINRSLEGNWLALIQHLNSRKLHVVSVDVPSGFLSEWRTNTTSAAIEAELVISFQRPKVNFFLPDTGSMINEFVVVDIGLDENFIQNEPSHWKLIEESDIKKILKPRAKFSYKGTYGHALIIAGSERMMGAALLCSEACVKTGAGLTTACIPESGNTSLTIRIPEAMIINQNTEIKNFTTFNSIAIGPGFGTGESSKKLLWDVLEDCNTALVLDADALNMLSENKEWLTNLPKGNCIITPHLKEFDRLFGEHKTWWERLETAQAHARELQIVIVLKNRYTFIVVPDGAILINPTGSPAMATGGMGDVLTGMIVSFLAQGYTVTEAALLAVYIHGKCGEQEKQVVIPASDLVKEIPKVIYDF